MGLPGAPFFLRGWPAGAPSPPECRHPVSGPNAHAPFFLLRFFAARCRLQSELMALMMSAESGISAFPDGDNIFQWTGTITGGGGTVRSALCTRHTAGEGLTRAEHHSTTRDAHPQDAERGP